MQAAGQGIAAFHCKRHVEHKARHGSHWHGSYSAGELRPYLTAAGAFIRPRMEADPFIKAAVEGLAALMESAGPAEIATRLRGLSAERRAKIALARLREAGIKPERLLANHLAVTALIEEDPGSHRIKEFRLVQVAKAVHRLASGTHRVWEYQDAQGRTRRTELHAYARSTGRVLRLLGGMIERECELVADRHLPGMIALKVKRYGPHPALSPSRQTDQSQHHISR